MLRWRYDIVRDGRIRPAATRCIQRLPDVKKRSMSRSV